MTTSFGFKRYQMVMCCLDPVHTGKGGVEIGYIDSEILREPGTNLPKIAGKAIKGMCRLNAALAYQAAGKSEFCAGKDKHCGVCHVCKTFGTSMLQNESMGLFEFNDAHICLFPVYSSTHGPVWVTTMERYELLADGSISIPDDISGTDVCAFFDESEIIALGKRLFKNIKTNLSMVTDEIIQRFKPHKQINQILNRKMIIAVPDAVFSKIVNENLEIRTSVTINPLTGTAEEGGLYTYEAIPMGTVLISDSCGYYKEPEQDRVFNGFDKLWKTPRMIVENGLKLCEFTGLGGMKTPGFGRMKFILKEQS